MKPLWKQLLYLHGHASPGQLHWRTDAPRPRGRHARPAARPLPAMLRWREALRTALVG